MFPPFSFLIHNDVSILVNAGLIQFLCEFEGPDVAIQETSVDRDPAGPANARFECENQRASCMNLGEIWSVRVVELARCLGHGVVSILNSILIDGEIFYVESGNPFALAGLLK